MRNFITLDLSSYLNLEFEHNSISVPAMRSQFVPCQEGTNVLTIHNLSADDLDILGLQMFELGIDKLKFFGKIHKNGLDWQGHIIPGKGSWSLSYQYPVFSWLHHVLDLGLMIKPVCHHELPKNIDRLRFQA